MIVNLLRLTNEKTASRGWRNAGTVDMDSQRLLTPSLSEHQTTPDQVNQSSDAEQSTWRNVCHNFSPLYIYKTKIVSQRM